MVLAANCTQGKVSRYDMTALSECQLFADDCILYCIIKEKHDQDILQADINQLIEWSEISQMTLMLANV